MKKFFFSSLKTLKEGGGSGSGSIRQRYGSADPGPHQNVTDPQHRQEGWAYMAARVKNKSGGGGQKSYKKDDKKNVGLLQIAPPRINV
jgi:hypothetical protein